MKKMATIITAIILALCLCACESNISVTINDPDAAEGFDADSDELLNSVVKRAKDIRNKQMGYPGNEDVRLRGFYEWYLKNDMDSALLNNAGDPNEHSSDHAALDVEHEVIKFFAPFYGFDTDEVWGLVSASGTDGNDHGIYFGRNYLQSETGLAPILYVSTESHYSNMRLAELQQIETRMIPTDDMGRMIPEEFRKALDPKRPALVVFSMGTTFKGGIDDQQVLNKIIDEIDPPAVYRHVDAALFGGYLPFTDYSEFVDRRACGFDSIAVSGHKFFGMDEPCGLFFTTKDILAKQNPYNISYLNESMPMINCSRSALNPLKFYWIINNTGEEGFRAQACEMLDNAAYLKQRLDEIGWPAWISCEQSNTVFFARPGDSIMEKYYLAPDHDDRFGGDLAHVVVMQNVSKDAIDSLIEDMLEEMNSAAGGELDPAA